MTSEYGGQLTGQQVAAGASTYVIDPAYSSVSLKARNHMATSTHGVFRKFAGMLSLNTERPDKTALAVYVTTSSIDTGWQEMDAHMCGSAFLDAERYPLMAFSTSSAEAPGAGLYRLFGSLSVRGVTRRLVVDGEYRGRAPGPQGDERIGFVGRSVLKRSEWGPLWGQGGDAGRWAVGDEMELLFEVSAVKRTAPRWWP
ncbi:YceI family protein [Streptomyces sp. NPDC093675]|uniref:YceI family protein n=1 Tax=Streptomyces sp. NPDC093675 TaxID=3366049 RepID=UPI0037F2696C